MALIIYPKYLISFNDFEGFRLEYVKCFIIHYYSNILPVLLNLNNRKLLRIIYRRNKTVTVLIIMCLKFMFG